MSFSKLLKLANHFHQKYAVKKSLEPSNKPYGYGFRDTPTFEKKMFKYEVFYEKDGKFHKLVTFAENDEDIKSKFDQLDLGGEFISAIRI